MTEDDVTPLPEHADDNLSTRDPDIQREADGRERHTFALIFGRQNEGRLIVRKHPGTGEVTLAMQVARTPRPE